MNQNPIEVKNLTFNAVIKRIYDNLEFASKKEKITRSWGRRGKTTLLNSIGGHPMPEQGEICLSDTDICRLSNRELYEVRKRDWDKLVPIR